MPKKARDLLPPDGPAPVDPKTVRPSDDDLDSDVETRKIGIRRVSALNFSDKLHARTRRRPAGNSRRFWRQIEADDPFKKRPARPTDAPLEIYPSQRVDRVQGSLPKPQPDVAKAWEGSRPTAPTEAVDAPRKPLRESKRVAPEPTHTPEPRPAPTPPTPPAAQPAPPEPPPQAAPPDPMEAERRHLPPLPPKSSRSKTGRTRMPSRAAAPQPVYGSGGKTAAEIREEKRIARQNDGEDKHPIVERKSLDKYREMMQNLQYMQEAQERGEDVDRIHAELMSADKVEAPRRVKPKREVKRGDKATRREVKRKPKAPKAEAPSPTPRAPAPLPDVAPPPIDRTPPKPKSADKPIDRSPSKSAGGNSGGLNDLFGGGAGDRVRVGRRRMPSAADKTDEE